MQQRISPVLFFRLAAFASMVLLAGCGSDADDATPTTAAATDTSAASTDTSAVPESASETTVQEITTVSVADDTTTSTEEPTEEPDDEIGILCSAYLQSISFDTVDEGLATLTEIMGDDAPIGVQDALETLRNPAGDIEGYFAAQNTVDGYVLPICKERFSSAIVPAEDDAAAAEAFLIAVRDGDFEAAERLAPTNVLVSFDWNGFPDATSMFEADNSTVTMLLEPTVNVFCQMADGAVEFCAFGE